MRNLLELSYPAGFWSAKWREALPSGNGEIGIGVYGGVHKETILLNHEDLWADTVRPPLPNICDCLQSVRDLLNDGKVAQAQDIMTNALIERGYTPKVAWPLPLGDLKIETPVKKAFMNYKRTLNMETGEITVTWQDGANFSRRAFVSRIDNIIVLSIKADRDNALKNILISLNIHDPDNASKPFGAEKVRLPHNIESYAKGEYIYYAATYDYSGDFGAVARVITKSASIDKDVIQLEDTDEATVIIKLFVNMPRYEGFNLCHKNLDSIHEDYQTLLERHSLVHSKLFLSSRLSVDDSTNKDYSLTNEELLLNAFRGNVSPVYIEKMWSFGRYLLISSSRETGLPCPLLGLWHGDYKAMWTFNMLNENLQMIYWLALSGNMPELLLAVFDYFESMMDDFHENAQKLFGCRGIYIPAVTTPHVGTIQCIPRHILAWTAGAGWLGQMYYDYYSYTLDEDFLKERALPFLREVALFYEDFFIIGQEGYYESIPSVSPENSPGNYIGKPEFPYPEVTMNATMDFAVAKEVLTHLIDGSKKVKKYEDEIEKWENMLSTIPHYQINDDGAVREWMHPMFEDNYEHRHQSHLYPIFPGNEITRENNPKLFEAFVIAVKKRLKIGISSQTSWSFAHMACIYARIGDGDSALECLDNLLRVCVMNNFFTVHNDWRSMGVGMDMPRAPFQIDANMGFTAAINDMLLLSHDNILRILPALPSSWKNGEVIGIAARHGIKADISWNREKRNITLSLYATQDCSISLLLMHDIVHAVLNKKEVLFDGKKLPNLSLQAKKQHQIEIILKEF